MATKTLKENINATGDTKWTVSGSGTNEYYLTDLDDAQKVTVEPTFISEDGTDLTAGTVGSLTAGKWDWADNDSLGFSTVYVRLTAGGPDPDDEVHQTLIARTTTSIATSNIRVAGDSLNIPDFVPVAYELANTDFSEKPLAANGNRRLVQIQNPDATNTYYYAWTNTQPAAITTMTALAPGEIHWFSAKDGIPQSALYAYQASGGALNILVAVSEGI